MTPHQAWSRARQQQRSALRPKPRCPWWPYVWSLRTPVKIAPDGTVPLGSQRLKLPLPPATRVTRCQHPDGTYSVLAAPPRKNAKPSVLLRYGPSLQQPRS